MCVALPNLLLMSDRDPTTRVEALAPWAAGLLLAAPVLLAYYPPMTDLAFHEAAIGLLRHFGDPAMVPPGLYVRNLGEPNQLFHMLGWALSYAMSTRWAVKLLVAAAVAAVPVAAGRFARHVGASPLSALLVAPMALGWLFSWGLITNLVGLAVLLAVLPELDLLADRPSARTALRSLGVVVLLYFAHMAMMVVYAGIALGFAILHPWSWKRTAWRVSPLLAAGAITLGQLQWQKPFMSPAVRALPKVWHGPLVKLGWISSIVLPATDKVVRLSMLALCALVLAAFFFHRAQERRLARPTSPAAGSRGERARAWALAHRWEIVAAASFAAYMAFPMSLNGATLVYQRWLPPAFAIIAVVAAPRRLWAQQTRVAAFGAAALPVATLFVAGASFADSDRQYRELDAIIGRIEPGSAVAEINLGPGDPTRTYSLSPADGRIMATRGGRLVYAFTDSSVSPVVLRRRFQWNESLVRVGYDAWAFCPAHDLKRFRYALLRTHDPVLRWLASYSLAGEARLIAESGEWVLFESKLPLVAVTSPDAPLPVPRPESMRDRIRKLVDAARSAPDAPKVAVPDEKALEGDGARAPAP